MGCATTTDYKRTNAATVSKKCKIDRYSSVQKDTVFMGCGIQYLTDESLSEVLPYTSGSPDFS